jgi:hypothetical protein
MRTHWSDWSRSCLAAAVLLGLAALAVFKIPHGFEEQVGWYLILLPGAFFAPAISDFIARIIPRDHSFVFGGLLVCFNFIWYLLICFTCIKVYRIISGVPKDLSRK